MVGVADGTLIGIVRILDWKRRLRATALSTNAPSMLVTPALALAILPERLQPLPIQAIAGIAVGLALFGVLAESARRAYRRTTQAVRMLLLLAALLLPIASISSRSCVPTPNDRIASSISST